jgi:N-acetylated-alpha-linked acidic dipeptidase
MRKIITGGLLTMLAMYQPVSAQKTITGFTDKTATEQKQLEQRFDALLNAERIGQTIKELSAVPHHVGSPGGKVVAENILNKFKSRNLPGFVSIAKNKGAGNVIANDL